MAGYVARGHGTILAVDDRPVNLALKRTIFEPLGYTVLTGSSMAEGFALARAKVPDLIISDVEMGDGSGFDFIRKVKADPRLSHIPFVFITSTHTDEESRAKGLALGAVSFLFRPLGPQELMAAIGRYLPASG